MNFFFRRIKMMKFNLCYPLCLHLFDTIYHGSIFSFELITFNSSFESSDGNSSRSESTDLGWHFRYTIAWILITLSFCKCC